MEIKNIQYPVSGRFEIKKKPKKLILDLGDKKEFFDTAIINGITYKRVNHE